MFDTTELAGVNIITSSGDEISSNIQKIIENSNERAKTLFDMNGQGLDLYYRDTKYKTDIDEADFIHADGQFLVFASYFKKKKILKRSATTDLIHDIFSDSNNTNLNHYLFGGEPGVANKASINLKKIYPLSKICGTDHGYFSNLEDSLIKIKRLKPNIIWLGLGKPLEQEVAHKIKKEISNCLIITCGGCFNFINGDYPRAPNWMQKTGLEWLFRLLDNPKKLGIRYLVTNFTSIYHLLFKTKWLN